jgi:hypothetical protein
MMDHLSGASGGCLEMGMWALYYWFQKSWQCGAGACYITKRFAQVIATMLSSEDPTILKLALYVHCQLWITDGREYGEPKVVSCLLKRYMAAASSLMDMIASPTAEISALTLLLLNNCMASQQICFERLNEMSLLEPICYVLQEGSAGAKIEAVELLCTILLGTPPDDLAFKVDEAIVYKLLEAMDMGVSEINASVFEVFQYVIPSVPLVLNVLVTEDFDDNFMDVPPELDPGEAVDSILEMIFDARERQSGD